MNNTKALETLRKLQKCRHTYYHTDNPCGDCEKCQYYVDDVADLDDAVDTAISALEQSIWIPCKDTPPEENDEYMVTWRTSDSKKPFINILEFDLTDGWILEDYMKTYRDVAIVAWRPIPELYKGD